jgi:hypothetical protein
VRKFRPNATSVPDAVFLILINFFKILSQLSCRRQPEPRVISLNHCFT